MPETKSPAADLASVQGIHHVTAIARDPQATVNFYTRTLGLRFVKRTVNFDAPDAYHLYFGDHVGSPGTALTFFTWPDLTTRGRAGHGQALAFSFSVPVGSLENWAAHLRAEKAAIEGISDGFGERVLALRDQDGFSIELVEAPGDTRAPGAMSGFVPESMAIRGFHTVPLGASAPEATAGHLVEHLGFRLVRSEPGRTRYEAGPGGPGRYADVVTTRTRGQPGVGTIHHVAWRVPDDEAEAAMLRRLAAAGINAGPVRDRTYFRSLYWREPSAILFEIATDTPGFTVDEPVASLGQALRLPPQYERARAQIEAHLPHLTVPAPEGRRK